MKRLARLRDRWSQERPRVLELVALSELGSWSTWVQSPGVELQCRSGELWITQEGDPEDHLLSAPDRFVTSRRGRLGVTGLTEARFTLAWPTSAPPSRPVAPLGRPGPDADQAA
jgi:hypothetical protein